MAYAGASDQASSQRSTDLSLPARAAAGGRGARAAQLAQGRISSMSAPTWASLTGGWMRAAAVGFFAISTAGRNGDFHRHACGGLRGVENRLSAGSIKSRCATPSTCSAALIADRQTDTTPAGPVDSDTRAWRPPARPARLYVENRPHAVVMMLLDWTVKRSPMGRVSSSLSGAYLVQTSAGAVPSPSRASTQMRTSQARGWWRSRPRPVRPRSMEDVAIARACG